MVAKVTTATAILMLVLFSVRTSLPQNCVPECVSNADCATDRVCSGERCLDPCKFLICDFNTICHATNHSATCKSTYPPVTGLQYSVPECVSNADCATDRVCYGERCLDPCKFVICDFNAICHATNHIATCKITYPPVTGLQYSDKPECITNMNCTLEEACQDNKCQNPCRTASCGENTVCVTRNHTALCYCKTGYNGNGATGCVESKNCVKIKKFKLFKYKDSTWQEALDHCNSMGMKLATINSQEEQNTVHNLTNPSWTWLGGSDLGDTGNYTWRSTNSTITYTNWVEGEPDNKKYSTGEQDHCIVKRSDGKWFDWDCEQRLNPICEYYD